MKKELILLILLTFIIIMLQEKTSSTYLPSNDATLKNVFSRLSLFFTKDILKNAEKVARLESNHFKSKGFKDTNAFGMQATSTTYPFGWSSLRPFWDMYPEFAPVRILKKLENKQPDIPNSGKMQSFLVFKSIDGGVASLAERLRLLNNNAGGYFSKNPASQKSYNNKLSKIVARYV